VRARQISQESFSRTNPMWLDPPHAKGLRDSRTEKSNLLHHGQETSIRQREVSRYRWAVAESGATEREGPVGPSVPTPSDRDLDEVPWSLSRFTSTMSSL
jgi:hypothetical protein